MIATVYTAGDLFWRNGMEYGITEKGGIKEIKLTGRLTFADNKLFKDVVSRVEEHLGECCVFDLANLEYIDSAGLGMLILARDAAANKQQDLRLRGAQGQVQQMLRISKFETFMTIED